MFSFTLPKLNQVKVYCCPLLAPFTLGSQNDGLEVIGTGTLVAIKDFTCLITAKHITNLSEETDLLYPKNNEEAIIYRGDISSIKSNLSDHNNPLSKLDLSILYLKKNDIHDKYEFLPEELTSSNMIVKGNTGCTITGYPMGKNKSRFKNKFINAYQDAWEFATIEPDDYKKYGLNAEIHLALKYDQHVLTNKGQKVKPPKMKGFSGGPMWLHTDKGLLLTGIVSYNDHENRIVYGSRIELAKQAVYEYMLNKKL